MQQENNVTLRGIVNNATVETRDNGRLILRLCILTKYIYKSGSKTIEEVKYTDAIVYESTTNSKALLLAIQKDSLVTLRGRLKDIKQDAFTKTIVVTESLKLHKVDYLQPKTDF